MEIIKTVHSANQLQHHVVWVCKYRCRILKSGVCSYLRKALPALSQSIPGVTIETIGFDHDHLHIVMVILPKFSIAAVMGRLKSQSSSYMRRKFEFLAKVYWKENIVWPPGFRSTSTEVVVARSAHRTPGWPGGVYSVPLVFFKDLASPRCLSLAGAICRKGVAVNILVLLFRFR